MTTVAALNCSKCGIDPAPFLLIGSTAGASAFAALAEATRVVPGKPLRQRELLAAFLELAP